MTEEAFQPSGLPPPELLAAAFETLPVGVLVTDAGGRIALANAATENLFGHSRGELLGQPLALLISEHARACHQSHFSHFFSELSGGHGLLELQVSGLHRSGREFPVELRLRPCRTGEGLFAVASLTDISAVLETRRELERQSKLMEIAESTAHVGGWEYDLVTDELYWTRETYRLHALDPETYTPTLESATRFTAPEFRQVVEDSFRELHLGRSIETDYKLIDNEGRERYARVRGKVGFVDGKPRKVYGSVQDVSEMQQALTDLQRLANELAWQAGHDALTGLVNRREFERRLEDALREAHAGKANHVMCYLDLDNFKVINDTCGHSAGDALLRRVAEILLEELREQDSVARLGGDEFGILLTNCDPGEAAQYIQRLLQALDAHRFAWNSRVFRCGASFGLVAIDADAASPYELLGQADEACYAAKEAGGGRLHTYVAHDFEIERRRGEMESVSKILKGLDQSVFFLAHQPLAALNAAQHGAHFEILLRLRDPDSGEEILPGRFLPAAERFRLSPRIDRWVIDRALSFLADQREHLDELFLCSINLSGLSLSQPELKDYVQDRLDHYAIPGEKICFEITETAAIENMVGAIAFMRALRERGCRFALDDFGSGLSSFAYLRSLPVDFVKIDGMFVRDLHENPVHLSIVRSIHEISRLMGMRTTAEFVENARIMELLHDIGIDFAQGYAIGRPQSLDLRALKPHG